MEIHRGEVLGLVGESASGKTTVGTSLLDYQRRGAKIAGGHVEIDGKDVLAMDAGALRAHPRRRDQLRAAGLVGVAQPGAADRHAAHGDPRGARLRLLAGGPRGPPRADDGRGAAAVATRQFLRRYPHQLSGGQQQRVAIAMAFANRPKVIVLDEPTTALDVTTQAHVLETRPRPHASSYGVAALYITHDLAVVANLADRIAVMYAGKVVEIGTRDELFDQGHHPYTRKLLASIPDITGERALRGIPGWAPRPGQRPPGCAFTPRCDWAVDKCSEQFPPVEDVSPGHRVRCWRYKEVGAQHAATDIQLRDKSLSAPRAEEKQVISVRDVTAYYQQREMLHDINASLSERRCLSLVGESGSGKTTLARCIAGLHPHKIVGDIEFNGKPLARDARGRSRATRQAIQYIFQSPYSSLNPRKTIAQILSQPLKVFFDLSRDEMEDRMVKVLEQVALDSSPAEPLPGPALRRRAPAPGHRAQPGGRADGADLRRGHLVAGRLGAGGDHRAAGRACSATWVSRCCSSRTTCALVRSISQEVAVMNDGRIVEYGLVDAVLEDPQADYTKKLLSDTPTV